MRLPDYNEKNARWDAFKVFHIGHGDKYQIYNSEPSRAPFIQTVNGELFLQQREWRQKERRAFTNLNVEIIATNDARFPKVKTFNGTPVKRSWLQHGGNQVMLIDYDHKWVVRVGYVRDEYNDDIPESLKNYAYVYWPNADAPPVARSRIKVWRPRVYTKAERAKVNKLKKACVAWFTMTQPELQSWRSVWMKDSFEFLGPHKDDMDNRVLRQPLEMKHILACESLSDLRPALRCRIAKHGVCTDYSGQLHPYLLLD